MLCLQVSNNFKFKELFGRELSNQGTTYSDEVRALVENNIDH